MAERATKAVTNQHSGKTVTQVHGFHHDSFVVHSGRDEQTIVLRAESKRVGSSGRCIKRARPQSRKRRARERKEVPTTHEADPCGKAWLSIYVMKICPKGRVGLDDTSGVSVTVAVQARVTTPNPRQRSYF